MAISISTSIISCLKAFNAFVEKLQDPVNEDPAALLVRPWQDELGRLRIWAANIGAHQTNQSALDYRLRDSSHVRQQIMNLLGELLNRLHEAENAILEDEVDDDDIESLEGSSSEDEALQTDVHRLQRSVATIITCLFQMSMLVRKPAPHDLRIGSRGAEVAAFEPFDYNHVRDKYPTAEEFIVSRLGHGITRRRQYLKYRERHALKLKQGISGVEDDTIHDNATSGVVLSETIATDLQDSNIKFDDNASQSGNSQTSYAPTLMSGGDITIPAPPRNSRGGAPFECPYCYFIVTAPSTRSWNRHVFDDLQPYMCLDKTCTTPHKLYATRHEWVHHSDTMHRREASGEGSKCVLCGDPQKTAQQHNRHVARHLQELALFVMPPNHDESDTEESCTHSDSGTVSPSGLATSHSGESNEDISTDRLPKGPPKGDQIPDTDASDEDTHERAREDIRGRSVQEHIVDDPVGSSGSSEKAFKDLEGHSASMSEDGEACLAPFSDPGKIGIDSRGGKTRIPRNAVNIRLLKLLGYSYEVDDDVLVLSTALYREFLDDFQRASKRGLDILDEGSKHRSGDVEQDVYTTSNKHEDSAFLVGDLDDKVKLAVHPGRNLVDLNKPTWLIAHVKHLATQTLDAYNLPWEWDDRDSSRIIIKQYLNEDDQERLFEHTRELRRLRARRG